MQEELSAMTMHPHRYPLSNRRARLGLGGVALWLLASTTLACGSTEPDSSNECTDLFKCDVPTQPDQELCVARRSDAFNQNQVAFQPDFLRWSCADVNGVTNSDRGQEYCEYFAMVQLPANSEAEPAPEVAILGRNLGEDYSYGTTEEKLEISYEQLVALEQDEAAVVGQCIFSSWNSDIPGPIAACAGDGANCPSVLGVPVDDNIYRMKFYVNSAEAAQLLVQDCSVLPPGGDLENAKDPLNDDFYRACMLNGEINQTSYRKSDTTVCAASARMTECGCTAVDPDLNVGEYISPWDRMGFPLGTWSSPSALPAGCRFIDDGAGSQTLVSCDLSAADVIMGAFDLKGLCMQKYADNIVVHVPLPPAEALRCDPQASQSPYASSCSATPWVLEDHY